MKVIKHCNNDSHYYAILSEEDLRNRPMKCLEMRKAFGNFEDRALFSKKHSIMFEKEK